jgi:phage terminase large subunit-like protein
MRYLAAVLEHSALGLRIGESPHFVASTTPKPRPEVRRLVKSPHTVVTRGTTNAAHHLPAAVRARLEEAYAGTRLGRQELGGELLEDVEGALWTQALIDAHRVRAADLPDLGRTIVAVDPNAGGDDAAGIVVVALGATRMRDPQGHPVDHAYVLADLTLDPPTGSPQWARAAVDAYHRYAADAVVAETNNGGDMVGATIRQYDRDVRYRAVTATRGKAVRAEPVVGLYEQGRVHHAGSLPRLEDQLTTWTPAAGWSPDRLDALVWGCTDLMLKRRGGFASAA